MDKSRPVPEALHHNSGRVGLVQEQMPANSLRLLKPATLWQETGIVWQPLMFGLALLLSLFTTWIQIDKMGFAHLEYGIQIHRHLAVLGGYSGDPWQYRVLSDYAAEGLIIGLGGLGIAHSIAWGFISLRVIQGVLIFGLVVAYFRRLGLGTYTILIGWTMITWAMTYSNYAADLQFSTYSDIIFYLLAAVCILDGKYLWIFPIMILASLNRETSGFIPFMLLGYALTTTSPRKIDKKVLAIFGLSLATYLTVFFGLRHWYAPRPQLNPPGMDMLVNNLSSPATWIQLLATFAIVPLLALLAFRVWPRTLKLFFWMIVPAWLAVHLYASILAETRLLLLPFILIFIPGALFGMKREIMTSSQQSNQ